MNALLYNVQPMVLNFSCNKLECYASLIYVEKAAHS